LTRFTVFDWLREHTKLTVQLQQFIIRAPDPYFVIVEQSFLRDCLRSRWFIMPQHKHQLHYWRTDPHSLEMYKPYYIVSVSRDTFLQWKLMYSEYNMPCWSEDLE
jgi:hypothetical protein